MNTNAISPYGTIPTFEIQPITKQELKQLAAHIQSGKALCFTEEKRIIQSEKSIDAWIGEMARKKIQGYPSIDCIEIVYVLRRVCDLLKPKVVFSGEVRTVGKEEVIINELCKKILLGCSETVLEREFLDHVVQPLFYVQQNEVDWSRVMPFVTNGFTLESFRETVTCSQCEWVYKDVNGFWMAACYSNKDSISLWEEIIKQFGKDLTIEDFRNKNVVEEYVGLEKEATVLWHILAKTLNKNLFISVGVGDKKIELWQWILTRFSDELVLLDFLEYWDDDQGSAEVDTGIYHALRAACRGYPQCLEWILERFWDELTPEIMLDQRCIENKGRPCDFLFVAAERSTRIWHLLCRMLALSNVVIGEYLGVFKIGNERALLPKIQQIIDLHTEILKLNEKIENSPITAEEIDDVIHALEENVSKSESSEGYYLLAKLFSEPRDRTELSSKWYRQVLPSSPLYCEAKDALLKLLLDELSSDKPVVDDNQLVKLHEALSIAFLLQDLPRFNSELAKVKRQLVGTILGTQKDDPTLAWVDEEVTYFDLQCKLQLRENII